MNKSHVLNIVPTPIGNLEDITLRSLDTLKNSDYILCEDTRVSKKLLNKYNIEVQLVSFHSFNEHKTVQKHINQILDGKVVSLISDAGTPSISDPGFLIVRESIKNNIEINCLPGATALIPAIVNSGLSSERFVFEGFLPTKKGRNKRIKNLVDEKRSIVIYESPKRILKLINDLMGFLGEDRKASISRELSKIYQENIRGTLKELYDKLENINIKGEFVIVIDGKKK
ncbi:MAG: 16S rRNA (cytidine(1402)-2'-O)-methyltransferase [Flammeovirgaceae bacterium]|jgi:16S rRNA (cytidine1402-2'-O)-methyltransferase|nr:16S rRNA (cytidine(1402)-2'-O)-methyltransferase [Flammeovirgaceae bacterium]MEC7245227.1 16S rRNA (cytidine(1402)-2'-O)-methyltransferase [Bacteroidota bacterium]MEC7850669.1 16S rRNA (cytidine(1402)-2'-O)-methyltransferase [Bacteroidota bacterium]MEC8702079.1 16S rRNA (cytidine(1402)-2'-O)-methyltransferase [Bacteroidota bacterium]|tara:strand:- start:1607 stop:2290 length:684 start_codon:yes stop_codon:yes gene_type:complete